MLGATGSFCCRLNRCQVVATTIADGARAMATIAARVLQASIDSPTRWCFLARCRRLIIVDVSDAVWSNLRLVSVASVPCGPPGARESIGTAQHGHAECMDGRRRRRPTKAARASAL